MNGEQVYDTDCADHAVNIKNLLEYTPDYAQSTATNEFYYLDTNRSTEERPAQAAYNKGFAARKAVLGVSATVNTELPLNRYSFFERLHDELLPNSKLEINLVLESDASLIWQAADDCRVIVTKMQLIVPRLSFNAEGQKLYMSKYLEPRKWTYWRENVETSNSTAKRTGNFRISTGITRPRHVFVFIINDANNGVQTENPFLYNTFSVANNRTLNSCRLEVGNGNEYPEVYYRQSTEPTRVFRDFFKVCSWKLPWWNIVKYS